MSSNNNNKKSTGWNKNTIDKVIPILESNHGPKLTDEEIDSIKKEIFDNSKNTKEDFINSVGSVNLNDPVQFEKLAKENNVWIRNKKNETYSPKPNRFIDYNPESLPKDIRDSMKNALPIMISTYEKAKQEHITQINESIMLLPLLNLPIYTPYLLLILQGRGFLCVSDSLSVLTAYMLHIRMIFGDSSIITRVHYTQKWFFDRFKSKKLEKSDLLGLFEISKFDNTIVENTKTQFLKRFSNGKLKLKQLDRIFKSIMSIARCDPKNPYPWMITEKGELLYAVEDILDDMYNAISIINMQIITHISLYNDTENEMFINGLYQKTFQLINIYEATIMRIYDYSHHNHIPFYKYSSTFKTIDSIPKCEDIDITVINSIIKKRYEIDNIRMTMKTRTIQSIQWNKDVNEVIYPRKEHLLSFLDFIEYDKTIDEFQNDLGELDNYISKLNIEDDIENYKENISKETKQEIISNPEEKMEVEECCAYLQGIEMTHEFITNPKNISQAEEWKVEGKFDQENLPQESEIPEELKKWASELKKVEDSWIMKKEQRTLFSELGEKKYAKCFFCSSHLGLYYFKEYKYKIMWIEGLHHYITKHGIKPTEEFYMFIKNYLLE
jgi:hypothetical protein